MKWVPFDLFVINKARFGMGTKWVRHEMGQSGTKWDGHEMAGHEMAGTKWSGTKWPGTKWDIPVPVYTTTYFRVVK